MLVYDPKMGGLWERSKSRGPMQINASLLKLLNPYFD